MVIFVSLKTKKKKKLNTIRFSAHMHYQRISRIIHASLTWTLVEAKETKQWSG